MELFLCRFLGFEKGQVTCWLEELYIYGYIPKGITILKKKIYIGLLGFTNT